MHSVNVMDLKCQVKSSCQNIQCEASFLKTLWFRDQLSEKMFLLHVAKTPEETSSFARIAF